MSFEDDEKALNNIETSLRELIPKMRENLENLSGAFLDTEKRGITVHQLSVEKIRPVTRRLMRLIGSGKMNLSELSDKKVLKISCELIGLSIN